MFEDLDHAGEQDPSIGLVASLQVLGGREFPDLSRGEHREAPRTQYPEHGHRRRPAERSDREYQQHERQEAPAAVDAPLQRGPGDSGRKGEHHAAQGDDRDRPGVDRIVALALAVEQALDDVE
jgi:hypothetical protein